MPIWGAKRNGTSTAVPVRSESAGRCPVLPLQGELGARVIAAQAQLGTVLWVIPEKLATSRLLLARVSVEDAEELFERYTSDPQASLYMPWPPHRSLDQTRAFLQGRVEEWDSGDAYAWTVRWKDSGLVAGMADASIDGHKATLGYGFSRDVWDKGVGTEAVSAVVEALKGLPDLRRIWATCDVDNVGSARVLEKAGLVREGVLHQWDRHNVGDEPRDCFLYAMWRSADDKWTLEGQSHDRGGAKRR